ncbi:MAG: hypothetical protein AB8B61_09025 [Cyclobacteriaceae bacterium]
MTVTFIALLIFLGILLIVVEVIFVPGTTVVGLLGFVAIGVGLYYGFLKGNTAGLLFLGVTMIVCAALVTIAIRKKVWKRYSLQSEITGKVAKTGELLEVGTIGKTLSALRPSGTALFDNKRVEVSSLGSFIDSDVSVKIIQAGKKILVEKA